MSRIYLIDYLKTISILMVIFTHYEWAEKGNPFFTLVIAMAVPIFMIVSGYNMTMSYTRKTNGTLRELYAPKLLWQRLSRFLLPFIMIYPLEMILLVVVRGETFTWQELLYHFYRGGLGPGSYYVPVLVVLLFTFPLIFTAVSRLSYWGVWVVGAANLIYEILVVVCEMDRETYRLLFFRYLLYVALGCYLYFHYRDKKKYPLPRWALVAMFVIGLGLPLAVYQFGWDPPIFPYWRKTAMPLALYIFPIIYVLMHYFREKQIPGVAGRVFVKISQASYHIFLVQMVYYRVFDDIVFPPELGLPPALVISGNILISVLVGYGFYILEKLIRKERIK